jgi:hypothetical protein
MLNPKLENLKTPKHTYPNLLKKTQKTETTLTETLFKPLTPKTPENPLKSPNF